jgi:antitoxin HicB
MTELTELSRSDEKIEALLRQPYARIILPESDGTFRGEIMEFPGCIATGDSAPEALANLEEAAKGWLLAAVSRGQNIPQPIDNNNDFSGRLVLRLPKSIHKKATWVAEREGVSLNQFIVSSLSFTVGEKYSPTIATVFSISHTKNRNIFNTSILAEPILRSITSALGDSGSVTTGTGQLTSIPQLSGSSSKGLLIVGGLTNAGG